MQDNLFTGPAPELLARPEGPLTGLGAELDELRALIARAAALVPEAMLETVENLAAGIGDFAAPITFVGQVKAGKTTLVNMLIGQPGLLPADVNPWTSVVTTLHLNGARPKNVRAEFRFFDREEWAGLIEDGGRLGQMARRAGADSEFEEIRTRVEEMRARARQRLGRNFELLMGSQHNYDVISPELIERYVCLGEDEPGAPAQGRFADITRSADIYLDVPGYPVPLALRDTPGVNDPLLIREQITLRSIGDSALCVVVLSAAQALNTVDLALIQLLSAMEGRQVILFVNRIDELDDPARQITEIRAALTARLAASEITEVAGIVFGSARWAGLVMSDELGALGAQALDAIAALSGHEPGTLPTAARVWALSGLPELQDTIGRAIAAGPGRRALDGTRRHLANVVTAALAREVTARGLAQPQLSAAETEAKLGRLSRATQSYVGADLAACVSRLEQRVGQASDEFITATVARLMEQTSRSGGVAPERCDPMQLRIRLRAAWVRFGAEARALFGSVGSGLAEALSDLFAQMLGEAAKGLSFTAPQVPLPPPPVALGGTIVVDLNLSWLKGWIAVRIGRNSLARDYEKLVRAEVSAIADSVTGSARDTAAEMARVLEAFLAEQGELALVLARGQMSADVAARLPALARREGLRALEAELRTRGEAWNEAGFSGGKVVELRNAV